MDFWVLMRAREGLSHCVALLGYKTTVRWLARLLKVKPRENVETSYQKCSESEALVDVDSEERAIEWKS